jgi:hypothetical protein
VANREQETTCLITAHETSNHNQYRYSFTVLGRPYTGISQSPTDSAVVGEQMKVYFDPDDPTTNSLEDFSLASRRDFGPLPLLVGGILAVAGFIGMTKMRSKRTATL